ncbi:MAG: hypothetical protein ATN35_01915 [Epulopiscium sp. Nele67-Bin004]|nr:MAG: hypothetical protein ATN35_01915 [Epulopiscium sp. Nele67-Bin004]
MILQLNCKNFKSIREPIKFSMVAHKDDSMSSQLIQYNDKIKVLKEALIYGANSAGKTNILSAFGYMQHLVISCILFQEGDNILHPSHKLEEKNPTCIDIQFVYNNNRYLYGFEVNSVYVSKEYLYHYPNQRQAKIFEREGETYTFGDSFKKEFQEIQQTKTKQNRLFLSTLASWTSRSEVIEPFIFFKEMIVTNHNNAILSTWWEYTVDTMIEDRARKQQIINIFKSMGIKIDDILVKREEVKVSEDSLPTSMPEEFKKMLLTNKAVSRDVKFQYSTMKLDLREESLGTQKLFDLIGPIIDILDKGKIFILDELETSLHLALAKEIIKMFNDPKINKNNAQLICSTHDVNLLDLTLLRRDQIWFAEKNWDTYSTKIYSLSDVKNVRKDENIERGYLLGKYGGIPELKDMRVLFDE